MTINKLKKSLNQKPAIECFNLLKTFYENNPTALDKDTLRDILQYISANALKPENDFLALTRTPFIRYLVSLSTSLSADTEDFLNFLVDNSALIQASINAYLGQLIKIAYSSQHLPFVDWILKYSNITTETLYDNKQLREILTTLNAQPDINFVRYFFAKILQRDNALLESISIVTTYGQLNLLQAILDFAETTYGIEALRGYLTDLNSSGRSALVCAIMHNQLAALKILLNYNPDLSKDNYGIFIAAISFQSVQSLLTLIIKLKTLGQNEISNITVENGLNLLQIAIRYEPEMTGDKPSPIFTLLLKQFAGQIADIYTPKGRNLAICACLMNKPMLANYLIKNYPELNLFAKREGEINALHDCILEKAWESAKWLIKEHDFNINEPMANGVAPLLLAAERNKLTFVEFLLTRPNINSHITDNNKRNLGHILVAQGHYGYAEILLNDRKIDLLAQDQAGLTMLDYELNKPNPSAAVLRSLYDLMNSVNKKNKTRSSELIINSPYLKKFLEFFCENYVNLEDGFYVAYGQSVLHIACRYLGIYFAQELIQKYNLNVNMLNKDGETVICYLAKNYSIEDAQLYYEIFPVNIKNVDSRQSSLLHIAIELKDLNFIEWCLAETPLNMSIMAKRESDGLSALDLALIQHNLQIVSCLWSQIADTAQHKYIQQLKKDRETEQLQFLIENELYVYPEETTQDDLQSEETKQADVACVSQVITEQSPLVKLSICAPALKEGRKAAVVLPQTIECSEELCQQAIINNDKRYIKQLKHFPQHAELLSSIAESILIRAIESNVTPGLLNHILRIPAIRAQAHTNKNAALIKAQELENYALVSCLLEVAQVKQTFEKQYQESKLDPNAPSWIGQPVCYTASPYYRYLIGVLEMYARNNFSADMEMHIFGSSIREKEPDDVDILFSNMAVNRFAKELEVNNFINFILNCGGKVTVIDKRTGQFGYHSPRRNPTRHVIPMEWMGKKLDLVLVDISQQKHASEADSKAATIYYDVRNSKLKAVDGIDGYSDLRNKIWDSVIDPVENYRQDLSRMFRAVRLISADTGYVLAQRCIDAIKLIFQGTENPFAKVSMISEGKLYQQLEKLFTAKNIKLNIQNLIELGVLDHLVQHLEALPGRTANHYCCMLKTLKSLISEQTDAINTDQEAENSSIVRLG